MSAVAERYRSLKTSFLQEEMATSLPDDSSGPKAKVAPEWA